MALRIRRNWLAIASGVMLGLIVLAGWAWHDGGIRQVREMSAPASLPGDGQ